MAARFPGVDLPPLRPAPRLGEHNAQVLAELGFDPARIARLLGPAAPREER
jgi:crotonobetainyl-CoA:carnitine CoA-transferase CaiB-like acyl-CoA transferase